MFNNDFMVSMARQVVIDGLRRVFHDTAVDAAESHLAKAGVTLAWFHDAQDRLSDLLVEESKAREEQMVEIIAAALKLASSGSSDTNSGRMKEVAGEIGAAAAEKLLAERGGAAS